MSEVLVDAMKFKDAGLEAFWESLSNAASWIPSSLRKVLYRKLQMLEAARSLEDLAIPPGNRLERLKGNRAGPYSIRVNQQWRLCFRWSDNEAMEVEFCDYH